MTATLYQFPPRGWCVRPSASAAHFFQVINGRSVTACGNVRRHDQYIPEALAPEGSKPRCMCCLEALRTAAKKTRPTGAA